MNEVVDAVDGIIRRNTLTEKSSNFNNNESMSSPQQMRGSKARMMR